MALDMSRRALIGGTGIAAVAIAAPMAATAVLSHQEWEAAFARWKSLQTAWLALPLDTDGKTEREFMDREHEAWRALFETPAPHIAALHWKLHYLFGDEEADGEWDPAITRIVVTDAARLAQDGC